MKEIEINEKEFQDDYLLDGLDANGEVLDLAKAYCAGLGKYPPLTREEEEALFKQYEEKKDPLLRKEIIERHLRYIVWFIKKNKVTVEGLDFMDLVQEGNFALVKAFEKFDSQKNMRFVTYLNECLSNQFASNIQKQSTPFHINPDTKIIYDKYVKYRNEYKEKNGHEPSESEVIAKFNIKKYTYEGFKNMDAAGTMAISLDMPIDSDDDSFALHDVLPDDNNVFSHYDDYIDSKLLLWKIKEKLTPLEYYLFYNYNAGDEDITYRELANALGVSTTRVGFWLKDIYTKLKRIRIAQKKNVSSVGKIMKENLKPIDWPKKVVLIYLRDKLSIKEFYYVYNVWYLQSDEEKLKRKFGCDYEELKISMRGIIDNVNDTLNNHYQEVLSAVKKKHTLAQMSELDLSINIDIDYQISEWLDTLSYEEVIKILGDNYEKLDKNQKQTLSSYYNWKYRFKSFRSKDNVEAKINLKRHGFKRKKNLPLDKLYKVYLSNPEMFEEQTKMTLEGSLFSPYTHKKIKMTKNDSSAYYRSLWRLEEKYYNLDGYFTYDIPEKEMNRIIKQYKYIFTDDELKVLDEHSEYRIDRKTFEELGNEMGIQGVEVQRIYLWARNKVLLLSLGLYTVMVIENEPLYVEYINNQKFAITDISREAGRLRFIEHLSYDEIAQKLGITDDVESDQKKSRTTGTQKVSNIINKLTRLIEMHHYNIINEPHIEADKVQELLMSMKKLSGEDKNIIRDCYVEKFNIDMLKNKYGKTQAAINKVLMKFKYNYISFYKKDVDYEDIVKELNEHVTDTVLSEDQRVVLAYMEGIKCLDNSLGEKLPPEDIATLINTNTKNVLTIYHKGIFNIGAKKAGIIGTDLGRLSRKDVMEALKDKNLPLTEEEKVLIKQFKGIETETKSLEELGEMHKVNATSIKRRIQNIYLSILKYQDGSIEKKYDFEEDISSILKYLPLFYQNIIIDIYRDHLTHKEIASKHNMEYEKIIVEISEATKRLYYILKNPKAVKFDFDYARKVINDPNIPYYRNEKVDVVYLFNRLTGNDGEVPASKNVIQESLNLPSSFKLNIVIRQMMVAICKYHDGYRKAKNYTRSEIEDFYNMHEEELDDYIKKLFNYTLRDKAQVFKGVNDYVLYEMLKRETDDLLILDQLSIEDIRSIINGNPFHLTSNQLKYLAFEYSIPERELLSGKQKRKLYRTLAPFFKEYKAKKDPSLKKDNNL